MAILSTSKLHLHYGDIPILSNINLDINKANINVEKLYGIKKAMSWFFNHKKYRQRQRQLNKDYFVQRRISRWR